ncbi:hypothetical protein SLA2020_191150 [Shorea laevis]
MKGNEVLNAVEPENGRRKLREGDAYKGGQIKISVLKKRKGYQLQSSRFGVACVIGKSQRKRKREAKLLLSRFWNSKVIVL